MRTMRVVVAAVSAALILSASASAATYKVSAGAPANAALPGAFAAGLYDADAFYPGTQHPLRIHRGDRADAGALRLARTGPSDPVIRDGQ